MEKIFTKQYLVRYYEADFRGTLSPVTMLDYFQDAASGHSLRLGHSVMDLQKKNMTWVLSRYHVRMLRCPGVGETLQVRTWRSAVEGIFALREFELTDEMDNILALATSSWVIVNMDTKRPVKIESVFAELPVHDTRALTDDFRTLEKSGEWAEEKSFRVRMGDLDMNRHVNHTVYVEWALESMPGDVLQNCRLSEIEISYRGEAFHGDTVLARTDRLGNYDPPSFLHQITNARDGRELTRLKTIWQRCE